MDALRLCIVVGLLVIGCSSKPAAAPIAAETHLINPCAPVCTLEDIQRCIEGTSKNDCKCTNPCTGMRQ